MAFTEKCIRIVITKNIWKRLAAEVESRTGLDPFIFFFIFKFKFIDFEKIKFKFIDFKKTKFKFIDFEKSKFKFIDFAKVEFKFIDNSWADSNSKFKFNPTLVEDTRLEAKAKDTKKIRGQGQPFRGQTLSRPRTGMLEAKAKDQGHKRKCSPKKKKKTKKRPSKKFFWRSPKKKRSSQKFFKRSLQKNVFQKIFQALHKILTIQKIVLSSSRGQANFRGLEASRPRPRTSKSVLEDVLEAKDVLEDSTSV